MMSELPYHEISIYAVIGMILAVGLLFYIREFSPKRKQRVLAAGLFVAALNYVLFALTTFNEFWIAVEVVGLLLFLIFIWMAFHYSMWFVMLGWAAHIIWDMGVHPQETAPYVPYWYAWICVGFDALIAVYMAFSLARHE